MAVVEIRALRYAYPPFSPGGQPFPVLNGVDLTVERGEFLALMGPTGAGKTTLCLALIGIVPQSTGGVIGGRVEVLGQDTRRTPVAELARRIAIVFQDPESQAVGPTLEEEVAFGPENLGVAPIEIAERVSWALALVDLAEQCQRSPAQLSGGEKQRMAIAAALAMLPDVLILDEPTSGLDPVGQAEVFAAIARLRHERSMTLFMVSQDADRIALHADRVALLSQGRIVACAEPRQVFADAETLRDVGVASPQVTELALALNRTCGSSYHFILLDEAEQALRADLATSRASS